MFSHDTEQWLATVVDLVNNGDELTDLSKLAEFVGRHDISEVGPLRKADLDAVLEVRPRLAPIFDAPTDALAASLINHLVAAAAVNPRLTDHDGYEYHIHYFSPGASLAEHLAVDCGMALAQVLASGERERLRRCAAPDCSQLLVDLSRNRSKRYCDARTCGNRLHVAAYRERQRAIS
ncbi:MAG: CGNR zinc finger domain-containing protein [Nocardioidaceae bacterium]